MRVRENDTGQGASPLTRRVPLEAARVLPAAPEGATPYLTSRTGPRAP